MANAEAWGILSPLHKEAVFLFHSLPERQAEQIELFLAGLQVYWNLWAAGGTHLYLALLQEYQERIARTAEFVGPYARQQGGQI